MRNWLVFARTAVMIVLSLVLVVGLMLWLSGSLRWRIEPGPAGVDDRPAADGLEFVVASFVETARTGEAAGTIQPEREVAISSQLQMPARVVEMHAWPGQLVRPGQLLVRLDDSQVRKQLEQARAELATAQTEFDRLMSLGASATPLEKTRATNALQAARSKVEEVLTIQSYATIYAPPLPTTQPANTQPDRVEGLAAHSHWMVINRYAEAGQTVQPGQTLVRLFDRLQFVALVPESMRPHIEVGQSVQVQIDPLGGQCAGTIAEIVPQAERFSRLFQVKVVGPCQPGVIIGMSARMRVPTGELRQEVRVPASAVRRVGQLEMVFVERGGRLDRRLVQLGRQSQQEVIVLSGLAAGERVVRDASRVSN